MKQFILSIFAVAGIFMFQSCKEDVDLIGDFRETAVVYGLLDQSDSVHMIKITRAFIGPGNSLEIAQIPDSNYFQSVVATITEVGGLGRTWVLEDTLVDNKDENGIFYAPQQKLYFFETPVNAPLDASATYKLHVNVNNGQFEISGETNLVSGITCNMTAQTQNFSFAQNPAEYKSKIVQINTVGNSKVINTSLDVEFSERISSNYTKNSFHWELGEAEVTGTSMTFTASGQTFYNLMKARCETSDPNVDRRLMGSIWVTVTGGSEDLYSYMIVNKPTNSLVQSKPTFTNLSATNDHEVIGLFSSRYTLRFEKKFTDGVTPFIRCIDKNSTRELCQGPITGPYLFCSNHIADNQVGNEESYACQ